MLNSRDIGLLRPDVEANCRIWLERCKAEGLNVLVTNTVRDEEYQSWLYEQGRTRPGGIVTNSRTPTYHSDKAGLAFDFCKNVKGQEYSDGDFFRKAAAIAKEMGFSWGGDWTSFVDMPHIQWDNYGTWTNAKIRAGQLPPEMPLWKGDDDEVIYTKYEDVPTWYQPTIKRLMDEGSLKGTGNDEINVTETFCRVMTILDRRGTLDLRKKL